MAIRWHPIYVEASASKTILSLKGKPDVVHIWRGDGDPTPQTRFAPGRNIVPEDEMHDWGWKDGRLSYHGAASVGQSPGSESPFWLVLQYGTGHDTTECPACEATFPEYAAFCPMCGHRL